MYSIAPEKLLLYADKGLVVVNKPNGMITQLSDPDNVRSVSAVVLHRRAVLTQVTNRLRTSMRTFSALSWTVCRRRDSLRI